MAKKRNNYNKIYENRLEKTFWNHGYNQLIRYRRDHVDFEFDDDYISYDGFPLGMWICLVRKDWREGRLDSHKKEILKAVGLSKTKELQKWTSMCILAADYLDTHEIIDYKYRTPEGVLLGAWIDRQEKLMKSNQLSQEQSQMLREIGL